MTAVLDEFRIDRVRPQRAWGLLVITYLFFGGAGAGLFLASLWLRSILGEVGGLLLVAVGTACLFLDLGRPERFWRAYRRPQTSWISRGTICITLLVGLGGLHVLAVLAGAGGTIGETALASASGVAAVIVMVYTGFVLSPSPAIPFWNSAFFPMIFLAYSLLAGVDILVLGSLAGLGGDAPLAGLERIQLGLAIVILVMLASHLSVSAHAGPAARASIAELVRGRLRWPFLGGVIVMGLVVPIAISWPLVVLGGPPLTAIVAGLSVMRLVGDYLFRLLVIRAGHFDPPL
jgi:formate-dependent nitrite reductase membrane component NrfD